MTSILPLLAVFNLDYTLIPYHPGFNRYPLKKLENGTIIDRKNETVPYYPEVSAVFEKLNNSGIKSAVAYDNCTKEEAYELISVIGWQKYISYIEINYWNEYTDLDNFWKEVFNVTFLRLKKKSKVNFDQMIFFDNDLGNIRGAQELGVFSVRIDSDLDSSVERRGMTMQILEDTLKKYDLRQREKKTK